MSLTEGSDQRAAMNTLTLGKKVVGRNYPTYFVADLAANHDGDLNRAKMLIRLCAEAGADAAKFQNFRAETIVSEKGFKSLGTQLSHQSRWKKSVFQVYRAAELPWEWTPILRQECEACGIEYFSAPYDLEAVEMLDPYVNLFKIGSGDITWHEMLRAVASKSKPVLLATGASDISEVQRAVNEILAINSQLVLMQCNTNYTGSRENFRFINLRVLETFHTMFPSVVLGLSDHTPGHAAVLGAVALGASVVEKHFTDDDRREGPDHAFSMTPDAWREMVERTRELELALGSPVKRVEENERDTVVLQRRCLRAGADLTAGTVITPGLLKPLRPAPPDAFMPFEITALVGKSLACDVPAGEYLNAALLADAGQS